jgi:hypothetical protein
MLCYVWQFMQKNYHSIGLSRKPILFVEKLVKITENRYLNIELFQIFRSYDVLCNYRAHNLT